MCSFNGTILRMLSIQSLSRHMYHPRNIVSIFLILSSLSFTGCVRHQINTFERWCEQIQGTDLKSKYGFGPLFFLKYDEQSVSQDFVDYFNQQYVELAEGKFEQMVWHHERHLHLMNTSMINKTKTDDLIQAIEIGIEQYYENNLIPSDQCFYSAIVNLFDQVTIHTAESGGSGLWYETTVIPTKELEEES